MALSFRPVDHLPGNAAGESRELFASFLESGSRFALVEGATNKDRQRLQSAAQTWNRNSATKLKVRARGEDTYLERVEE